MKVEPSRLEDARNVPFAQENDNINKQERLETRAQHSQTIICTVDEYLTVVQKPASSLSLVVLQCLYYSPDRR
jgi:hypothetical protein